MFGFMNLLYTHLSQQHRNGEQANLLQNRVSLICGDFLFSSFLLHVAINDYTEKSPF